MLHLLPETLRGFRYYERKLPLYLRNDECFVSHFRIWYDLLMADGDEETSGIAITEFKGISPSSDLLLHLLNIYDKDFLSNVYLLYRYDPETRPSDLLDKLGNLFGLRRHFTIEYLETPTSEKKTQETITLNDSEFLTLIKAQIIRNYCDGSYQQVMEYYADANIEILPVQNDEHAATVDAYMNISEMVTTNIEKLFKAGMLTIEHLGIRYTYSLMALLRALCWSDVDGKSGNQTWSEDKLTGGQFVV